MKIGSIQNNKVQRYLNFASVCQDKSLHSLHDVEGELHGPTWGNKNKRMRHESFYRTDPTLTFQKHLSYKNSRVDYIRPFSLAFLYKASMFSHTQHSLVSSTRTCLHSLIQLVKLCMYLICNLPGRNRNYHLHNQLGGTCLCPGEPMASIPFLLIFLVFLRCQQPSHHYPSCIYYSAQRMEWTKNKQKLKTKNG